MNYRNLKNLNRDDLLDLLGLQTRRGPSDYLLPALGLVGAGMLIGAGAALLFAPQSGQSLREEIKDRLASGATNGHATSEYGAPGNIGRIDKTRPL